MLAENIQQNYKIEDKYFTPFISKNTIENTIENMAHNINTYYKNIITEENPLIIIGVLNGSFIFMSDLVKHLDLYCETHFIKVSSYEGTESTGKIKHTLKLNRNITNCNVLIVEDIVDTGFTIKSLVDDYMKEKPTSLNICTLLFKVDKYNYHDNKDINISFVGIKIPDKFVIGYGLDYNNFGRNLDSLYVLESN